MVKLRQRSKTSTFHIRAFITDKAAFLSTNLLEDSEVLIPSVGSTWLIGRNSTCAIAIRDLSVSRCHAIIGYHPIDGFYITDLGSSNGTWLNRRRMPLNERLKLENGNLLQFGHVPVDFSITNHGLPASSLLDVTYS